MPEHSATEIFLHIRVLMGIVLGISMTRLLTGLARFVQHPGQRKIDAVHIGWALSMLLMLTHFWWWEFWLTGVTHWTFQSYVFLIGYMSLLFLLCTLLFPDNIAEYTGYREFLMSRRRWFFGILAVTYLCDFLDTLMKGPEHLAMFGLEYMLRTPAYVVLCIIAMIVTNRRFHLAFVFGGLIYQVSFILRLFDTLT